MTLIDRYKIDCGLSNMITKLYKEHDFKVNNVYLVMNLKTLSLLFYFVGLQLCGNCYN